MSFEGLQPGSVHDQALRRLVAPPDWVNPAPKARYDLVVLGGGPAGLVAAAGAAGLGARVALVEKGLLGGDCLNAGCVPSKALLAAASRIRQIRGSASLGIQGEATVDFPRLMERMREKRASLARHDSAERFRDLGVDVFLGKGAFHGPETIQVGAAVLRFRKALIATGARASVPPIPGLREAGFHTNETIFSLTELPRRLLVIGGGPIGCELAQAFRQFGSEVSVVDQGVLVPRDEDIAREALRAAFQRDGIQVHEQTRIFQVSRRGENRIIALEDGGGVVELRGDAILVAAGRTLNLEGLDLDAAGIRMAGRRLVVDDRLRTTNPRVYVAGDAAGGPQFTHTADAQARLVLRNAFFLGRGKAAGLVVPWCTYTHPELAQIGLTEAMAREQGVETEVLKVDFSELDRGVLGEEVGFVQARVVKGTDRVVGFTVAGSHAGDLLGEAALLLWTTRRLSTFSAVIHPYPTLGEAFKRLGDLALKRRFTPRAQQLFRLWFRLWR